MDYDKERELGIAEGNVIWQDTTEKLTVVAEFAEHSKQRNYLKASGGKYGRPLLIKVIDGDSLYVSADTLMSLQPDTVAVIKTDSLQLTAADSSSAGKPTAPISQKPDNQPNKRPVKQPEPAIPQKLFDIPSEKDSLKVEPIVPQDSILLDSTIAPNRQSSIANRQSEDHRIILAFHDVRIFKSNLQALCDSLSYSSVDSMFRLFKQPIIWSDTSQFTADTVNIQLANDKIDRIFIRQNSFIINSPDEFFFNQIKGKNSIAMFDSSELRRVRVEGNAESVYYALDDDKAYIGVNKTVCSEMLIHFGNNEVEGIKFYTQPKATLFPMAKADHEGLKMAGFSWQIERRPGSVEDLLKVKTVVGVSSCCAEGGACGGGGGEVKKRCNSSRYCLNLPKKKSMVAETTGTYTVQEYLKLERRTGRKYAYYNGKLEQMAGELLTRSPNILSLLHDFTLNHLNWVL
ncbi:MAG: hypothetical protein IPM82_01925 [Saprospiraceae bacterium]|nr:hypothetical protein [Saprospiraceae bacterium]